MTVGLLGMTVGLLGMTVGLLGMTVGLLGMTVGLLGMTAGLLGMIVGLLGMTARNENWAGTLGMTVFPCPRSHPQRFAAQPRASTRPGSLLLAALLPAVLLSTSASAAGKDGVQVEDHGNGRYALTTTLAGTTDPAHGQLALVPRAEELCGERYPHYGHYEFESMAPSKPTGESGPTSLRYTQDIACLDTPQETSEAPSAPVPPAPSTPPNDADAALIRTRTMAYLQAKGTADAPAAYAMMSKEMAGYATPEAWADARRGFNAEAGPGAEPTVVRITWYDDPPDAPMPGRYVAADYRVDYPSAAFTCGYVAWLRQADGRYLIVREEEGEATPDDIARLSPGQKLSMRAQLQCRD